MRNFHTLLSGLVLVSTACGSDDGAETATAQLLSDEPSVLVDLDPSSTGTTLTVESIAANAAGQLFISDRESGNVLRIDPSNPTPVVVAKLQGRSDANGGMEVKANGAGLVFTPAGDLLIASGAFNEVLRLTASDLQAATPAAAQTFITGVQGANSVLLVGNDLYVTGGATGNIYVADVSGAPGAAQVWSKIEPSTRSVAPDGFMQSVVANGIARDPSGDLLVADTARAAIWKIPVDAAGNAGTPETLVQSSLLEGVDGLTFDPEGRLWAAVNERNALVVVEGGQAREAYKNGNAGPLEFPAAIVFVDDAGYVANFDRPRGQNFAADGVTSSAGVGSSIARFQL